MNKIIDARGLSCPQPLILATRAMKEPGGFEVIVDNAVARENIARMLADRFGITPEIRQDGLAITIRIVR